MSADVHYEYRWEDRSLILRWLRDPVFVPMVRALPRRLTPNQLTALGHGCVWISATIALLAPTRGPRVLLALSLGYAAFNLADTLDGLYARHSGRTSRLGELLDHGLDPISFGLVPLTYGLVMREPAWLILASTAMVAYVQFVTFLHGYRVGHVVLGEVGVIEALSVAAAMCIAAAAGGLEFLARPLVFGVSPAGLLAVGFIAGALAAVASMPALAHHVRDLVPLAVLDAAIVAWFAWGDIGITTAALLILASSACQSMIVTCSRLLPLPLALWDLRFVVMTAAAAGASIALSLAPRVQSGLAGVLIGYAALRAARLFVRTASRLR
jgi:phosphatidylglycerophosphate synthase